MLSPASKFVTLVGWKKGNKFASNKDFFGGEFFNLIENVLIIKHSQYSNYSPIGALSSTDLTLSATSWAKLVNRIYKFGP